MRNRILFRAVVALFAVVVVQWPAPAGAQQDGCTATLSPAQSIDDAVRQAREGAVICLRSGLYSPLTIGSAAPAGVTVRALTEGVNIVGTRTRPAVSIEADRFTLDGVVVREGAPMALRAVDVDSVLLRNVRVERAGVGIVLDSVSRSRLEDVSVNAPIDAGVVVANRSTVTAERLMVNGGGIGVAALSDGASLTMRGGRIEGSHGPAIFAGVLGCADVTTATIEVPACYYDDAARYVSSARLTLQDVTVNDGPGAGIVLYPGVTAQLTRTNIFGRGRGGLLVWGADLSATDSLIEANWEFGVAMRAYPHPGAQGFPRATGRLLRTTVRSTRSLSARIGGNGVIAAGAQVSVRESTLIWNDAAGIAMTEASSGELRDNTVTENRGVAICISADSTVGESGNRLSGNQQDLVLTCGRAIGDSLTVGPGDPD